MIRALEDYEPSVNAEQIGETWLNYLGDQHGTLWWGGYAWDSFALPHLLPGQDEVLVATRCPACGRPHAWNVDRNGPPDGDRLARTLEIVRGDGSIEHARGAVGEEVGRAVGLARQLPDGAARHALIQLARFLATRCGADPGSDGG